MKFLLLLLLPLAGFPQVKLEKISLLDNKVEILAPKKLSPMSNEQWAIKYGATKRPFLALSDENLEVNLLADLVGKGADDSQMVAYKDFRMQHLAKSRTDVKFLENGLKTVNGKKVGYFKFSSNSTDRKIFNYYFFITADGNMLFFTFNCPDDLRKSWEKTADEMVESLKVNPQP